MMHGSVEGISGSNAGMGRESAGQPPAACPINSALRMTSGAVSR